MDPKEDGQLSWLMAMCVSGSDDWVRTRDLPRPNPAPLPLSHTDHWDKYGQELCFVANVLGLIMIMKNEQLPAN